MRGRGRGGGKGGRGGGGYGRKDTRPGGGGGASRDDRDRRPDHRPRRTPSPDRRPRRPRGEDDDRDPPRGGRIGYGGGDRSPPRGGRIGYGGGDRSPPRGGRIGYGGGDRSPPRRERTGYASPRRGRVGYEDPRDPSGRGPNREYDGDRQSPRGRRDYSPPGARAYGRSSYREERDHYDRPGRSYDGAPPAYMLPDHPSDLGRPSLRTGKKESDYFGGHLKDDYLGGGPGPWSFGKESELFGDGGVTLRISANELGRTTAMYSQSRRSPPLRRSPPPRTVLSPPPLYPSVPPESGFLTGGSAMKASDGYGAGSTQLLHDDGNFKYHKHSHDHFERRDIERHYSGSRDLVAEKAGGTERFYSAGDVPPGRVRDTERLYSSRDMLEADLVPCAQLKPLGDSSSALLAKDHPYRMHTEPVYEPSNGYIMNGLGRSSHDSLGHDSGHPHRLSGSPLEHVSGHGDEALLDIARQAHSKHAPRSASMEYNGHDEYFRRDPIDDGYAAPENLRVKASRNSRHISGTASLRGIRDERVHHLRASHRIEEFESSIEAMHQDTEQLNKRSYDGDASVDYPTTRGGNDRYSHSPVTEPFGTARQPAHHRDASFENLSDQEASPMVSRKRYRSPAYLDHEIDVYQTDDEFVGYGRYDDVMDAYDPPPRGSIYDMVGDDEYDRRYEMPTNRNVFSRLALPDETNGEWTDTDQGSHARSDTVAYGRSKHMPISQRLSKPNFHSQFFGTSMHGRGRGRGGLTKSAKKRLRAATHQLHGGYPTEEHEFVKPNKFQKSSEDDPNGSEVKHEDAPECEDLSVQKDPPEGSEEFSKQVHQAFLKYAKILNESPPSQKKYRQASKGSLSCCVCGSVARKFPDVDALVSHAYDTCKAGLRTKHLGFHKALCVLMGWNWLVAPDTSKAHHSIPSEEVRDLMLWPPVVVIHNSSIVNKANDAEAKIVSMEEIEGVLADIGVPREKVKVSHGKPANQGIFLVKFQPTISGFQEAMRTNDHFSSRNHGKEELLQMIDGKGKKAAPIDTLKELLYAHIAVVEDLGYLDEEAKRRCKIRSKKEIEANADATMNLEP